MRPLSREDVSSEMEQVLSRRISFLSLLHVLVHLSFSSSTVYTAGRPTDLGDWHVEVEVETDNRPCEQYDEDGERRVLKVCPLHFHTPKLDSPPDRRIDGRGLEPDRLPVGRLDVFKVVHGRLVVLVYRLAELNQRITNEQVGDMRSELVVDRVLYESVVHGLIDWRVGIMVLWLISRVVGNIQADRVISGFGDDVPVVLQWLIVSEESLHIRVRLNPHLQPSFLLSAVIDRRSDDVPSRVNVGQLTPKSGTVRRESQL